MSEAGACPTDESLVALAAGLLPAAERPGVEHHVSACGICRAVLADALCGHDTLPAHRSARARVARGSTVGRYLLLEAVGSGGMGVVYAAYDPELDRRVALKMLHSTTERSSERLLGEARAMAKLGHDNVLPVYDTGTWAGRVFITMEFVVGQTLRSWLGAPRTVAEICSAYAAAGAGLLAAHRAGIVHRDFKPENVMVGDDGRVRVLDFGLARATRSEPLLPETVEHAGLADSRSTHTGTLLGTPRYMAPEQRAGLAVDARVDQYSFCLALSESLADAVPRHLRPVLARGTRPNPDDRFPSLEPVLEALAVNPLARRRRLLSMAAIACLVAGAAGVGTIGHWRRAHACDAVDGGVGAVWHADRRAEISKQFAALGKPFATLAAERSLATLDGYARAISAGARELCRARLEDEVGPALADRRERCFGARRDALGALTEVLVHADEQVAGEAIVAAASLPPLSTCLGAALDELAPSAGRLALARASSLYAAARYRDASAAAKELEASTDPRASPAIAAEAALISGRAALAQRLYGEARSALERTLIAAERARRGDLKALAHLELAELEGVHLINFSAGSLHLRLAEAALDGIDSGTAFRDQLLIGQALHFLAVGDGPRAVAAATEAIALRRTERGPEHPSLLSPMVALADAHEASLAHGEAETAARAALAFARRVFGPDDARVTRALVALALIHEGMGRFDEARAESDEVEARTRRQYGDGADALLPVWLRRIYLERAAGSVEGARAALERYRAGVERSANPSLWAVNLDMQEGLNLLAAGAPAEAWPLLESGVRQLEQQSQSSGADMVQVYAPLATAALRSGRTARAREVIDRCFAAIAASTLPASGLVQIDWLTAEVSLEAGHRTAEGWACAERAHSASKAAGDARGIARWEELLRRYPRPK